jgi:hypothetical protein
MEMMSDAAKKELHELVDALRDDQVDDAKERLLALQNEDADPFRDMTDEERARLHAVIAESRADAKAGKGISAEEMLHELESL